ncbi:hypothetical protein GIB67_030106 [Kingdonia uniflora]|uniref:ARM repeat superfamily protein n=1 Tax=Kingdonia uniflora TaxID=39325 RepID=A0A7J7L2G3_9MAGN|nr:hypothetical protein GIB67_030106 [Kingdonia uniflora]
MRDYSSAWFLSTTKLRFFTRIRRFMQTKPSKNCHKQSDHHSVAKNHIEDEIKIETMREYSPLVLQRSVKQLHFGSWEEKEVAANEIKRLASQDLKTRKSLAELAVIPSLVLMMDSGVLDRRRLAIQALIELANGTYTNKALIVEAGILSKLPGNVDAVDKLIRHDFVLLLLSISSLPNTQFPVASSVIIPFLVGVINSDSSIECKTACVGALYNLSAMLENASSLVSNGVVNILLQIALVKEASEKALATLGNLVMSLRGKKAIESNPTVPENLIEILTWEGNSKCQELSAYILMILAHQSSAQREKMTLLGIVPILLELALLGSPLVQKRSLKLLQWFKDERQTKMISHSGPQTGRVAMGSPVNQRDVNGGKKIIKSMVKQSLNKNMDLIMRRSSTDRDYTKLKGLIISSSSKSLPY